MSQSKVSLSPDIGPGAYDPESVRHKELVSTLYPRKQAPFNATESRQLGKTSSPKLEIPGNHLCNWKIAVGPGSYQSLRSDFSRTLAAKGIAEAGSYLINDNGHIN